MTFPLAFLTSNEYTEGHPFLKKQPNFSASETRLKQSTRHYCRNDHPHRKVATRPQILPPATKNMHRIGFTQHLYRRSRQKSCATSGAADPTSRNPDGDDRAREAPATQFRRLRLIQLLKSAERR
jgi:hypothetical protein